MSVGKLSRKGERLVPSLISRKVARKVTMIIRIKIKSQGANLIRS